MSVNFQTLAAPFPPSDLQWRPITISKNKQKGLAAAYIDARAIMDRLDQVVGPENWQDAYAPGPSGQGVMCKLGIRINGDWVWKTDGADNSDIEATKGGFSNALRRAAVKWGIGRYLYNLPDYWVSVDERGQIIKPPELPKAFLPTPPPDFSEATSKMEEFLKARKPDDYERAINASEQRISVWPHEHKTLAQDVIQSAKAIFNGRILFIDKMKNELLAAADTGSLDEVETTYAKYSKEFKEKRQWPQAWLDHATAAYDSIAQEITKRLASATDA